MLADLVCGAHSGQQLLQPAIVAAGKVASSLPNHRPVQLRTVVSTAKRVCRNRPQIRLVYQTLQCDTGLQVERAVVKGRILSRFAYAGLTQVSDRTVLFRTGLTFHNLHGSYQIQQVAFSCLLFGHETIPSGGYRFDCTAFIVVLAAEYYPEFMRCLDFGLTRQCCFAPTADCGERLWVLALLNTLREWFRVCCSVQGGC